MYFHWLCEINIIIMIMIIIIIIIIIIILTIDKITCESNEA